MRHSRLLTLAAGLLVGVLLPGCESKENTSASDSPAAPGAVAAPTFDPPAGFKGKGTVTLSSTTADANFYYTTDGSEPACSGTGTAGSTLTVDSNLTVKAIACKDGAPGSSVASASYQIIAGIFAATAHGMGATSASDVFIDSSTIYVTAAATGAGLAISTDGASSFSTRTTSHGLGHNATHSVVASGSLVFVGTKGGLSISTDGATSFTNKTTANGLGHNQVNDVFVQ